MEVDHPERGDFVDEVKDFEESIPDSDDEDDPVVEELDIHLSNIEDTEFMVLQYPLRPVYRPYGDEGHLSVAEFRPEQKALRLKYTLVKDDQTFDPNHEYANEDSHVLTSKGLPLSGNDQKNTSYALGFIRDNKIVLTPVSHIAQLRPDYSHVDASRKVVGAPEKNEGTHQVVNDEDIEDAAQAVEVTFRKLQKAVSGSDNRGERGGENFVRRETYMKIRQMEQQLPWKDLQVYDEDSLETSEIVELLCGAVETHGIPGEIIATQDDGTPQKSSPVCFVDAEIPYLTALSAVPASMRDAANTGLNSGPLAAATLSKFSMEQQILKVLTHLHLVRFERLKTLLTKVIPEDALIQLLSQVAHCVQGNWVVHSNLVAEGYAAMCRDLVILLLLQRQGGGLDRGKLLAATKLPADVLKCILDPLAIQDGPVWKFRLGVDEEFSSCHPEIVAFHLSSLNERKNEILVGIVQKQKEGLHLSCTAAALRPSAFDSNPHSNAGGSHIENDQRGLATVRNQAAEQGVSKELFDVIVDTLRGNAQSRDSIKVNVQRAVEFFKIDRAFSSEDIDACLPFLAENIRGIWVLNSFALEQNSLKAARDVILSIFRTFAAAPKDQILEELRVALGDNITNLPDVKFRHLLREVAVPMGGIFVFKAEANNPQDAKDIIQSARAQLLRQNNGVNAGTGAAATQ